jgi:cytochrome c5
MKKLFILPIFCMGMTAIADPSEDEIIARIQKVGTVCVQGTDCAATQPATVSVSTAAFDVVSSYDQSCATCHNLGVAGAPIFAESSQWAPRIDKGMEALYNSGINGMLPAMPARGMCFNCSDDDIKALVDYMVDAAR